MAVTAGAMIFKSLSAQRPNDGVRELDDDHGQRYRRHPAFQSAKQDRQTSHGQREAACEGVQATGAGRPLGCDHRNRGEPETHGGAAVVITAHD
jgi:hypothetical protein